MQHNFACETNISRDERTVLQKPQSLGAVNLGSHSYGIFAQHLTDMY